MTKICQPLFCHHQSLTSLHQGANYQLLTANCRLQDLKNSMLHNAESAKDSVAEGVNSVKVNVMKGADAAIDSMQNAADKVC